MNEPARFPCAQCGADLRYDPGAQSLLCDHCGHSQPATLVEPEHAGVAAEELREIDFHKALSDEIAGADVETTQTVSCENCGATVEFDENVHAAECPFCAPPVVTDTGSHRHFKPGGVLPFAVAEKDAQKALRTWLESRWFAPSGLRVFARSGRRMSGVYMPYWTFDAQTQTRYEGQRGDVYYVEQTRWVMRDGRRVRTRVRVPKVRWTPVRGRLQRFFDDVLVPASRSLPKRMIDRLSSWDLHALEPYRPDFLAGFRAEAYTVDLQEGFAAARAIMDLQIRRDVRFAIGGDKQRISSVRSQLSEETFKHILLPVWVAAYRYRDQSYRVIVNGRTGEVIGERPWSVWKIALAGAGAAVLAAALLYLAAIAGVFSR